MGKFSTVWNYVTLDHQKTGTSQDVQYYTCNHCQHSMKYSRRNGPNTIRDHLKRRHPDLILERNSDNVSETSEFQYETPESATNPHSEPMAVLEEQKLLDFLLENDLPFDIVMSPSFLCLFSHLEVPTMHHLHMILRWRYLDVEKAILDEIQHSDAVAICFDSLHIGSETTILAVMLHIFHQDETTTHLVTLEKTARGSLVDTVTSSLLDCVSKFSLAEKLLSICGGSSMTEQELYNFKCASLGEVLSSISLALPENSRFTNINCGCSRHQVNLLAIHLTMFPQSYSISLGLFQHVNYLDDKYVQALSVIGFDTDRVFSVALNYNLRKLLSLDNQVMNMIGVVKDFIMRSIHWGRKV